MSTEYNQASDELSQFLDTQFSDTEKEPSNDGMQPDEEINQYLISDDEVEQSQPDVIASQEPADKPVSQTQSTGFSNDDRIRLERELAATQARMQMYENAFMAQQQQQYQQAQPQTPNLVFNPDELNVDESYVEKYNDADPYIQAHAKRVANELYQRAVIPLQQELHNVRAQLESQAQFNQSQRTDSLYLQLKNAIPDIDDIASYPEWQSYLHQPDYYGSGRTIQSYVQEGIQTGNVRQLAQIVNQFKATRNQGKPQAQQVAPGRSQATIPNTQAHRSRGMLKMSEFDRATADFQAGKLSYDRYQQISDEFNAAFVDGRVNMNK